ncbi:hypothetical protein G9F32_16460 [Acinetobacter sp. 194]|nr:hypothetical protein [Acinetobacter shaoyimingii]
MGTPRELTSNAGNIEWDELDRVIALSKHKIRLGG